MGDALGRVPISSKICLLAGRKKKLGDGDEICISMEKTEKVYIEFSKNISFGNCFWEICFGFGKNKAEIPKNKDYFPKSSKRLCFWEIFGKLLGKEVSNAKEKLQRTM